MEASLFVSPSESTSMRTVHKAILKAATMQPAHVQMADFDNECKTARGRGRSSQI